MGDDQPERAEEAQEDRQVTAPATASARDKPCEVHGYHWPPPIETEGHHIYPVYLQNRVFGKIELPNLIWVCDTGHKNIHALLSWGLGERRNQPSGRGTRLERAIVKAAYDWYIEATTKEETP